MLSDIRTAFLLLGIGMLTVFTILAIVVWSGKLLIRVSNRLASQTTTVISGLGQKTVPNAKIAAITAALHQFADEQIHIEKIEKIEKR